MVEYYGDATAEEIKERVTTQLRGQLAGSTTEQQMTLEAATAALLLKLVPKEVLLRWITQQEKTNG